MHQFFKKLPLILTTLLLFSALTGCTKSVPQQPDQEQASTENTAAPEESESSEEDTSPAASAADPETVFQTYVAALPDSIYFGSTQGLFQIDPASGEQTLLAEGRVSGLQEYQGTLYATISIPAENPADYRMQLGRLQDEQLEILGEMSGVWYGASIYEDTLYLKALDDTAHAFDLTSGLAEKTSDPFLSFYEASDAGNFGKTAAQYGSIYSFSPVSEISCTLTETNLETGETRAIADCDKQALFDSNAFYYVENSEQTGSRAQIVRQNKTTQETEVLYKSASDTDCQILLLNIDEKNLYFAEGSVDGALAASCQKLSLQDGSVETVFAFQDYFPDTNWNGQSLPGRVEFADGSCYLEDSAGKIIQVK